MFKLAVPLLLAALATFATPATASAEEIEIVLDPAKCHRAYVVLEPIGQPGALVCRPKP